LNLQQFKVIQGIDDFATNRKRIYEFLLVMAENCAFFIPLYYSRPRSLCSL